MPPNIIHPHFVFCQTKNENKLKDIISLLNENNIKFSTWNEPDLQNELTAISTEPISGDKRQLLRKLSLIKG